MVWTETVALKVTRLVTILPPVNMTGFVPKVTVKGGEAGVFDATARLTFPAKP